MLLEIIITPAGQLRVVDADESVPEIPVAAGERLVAAFEESTAGGLIELASPGLGETLPASLVFWRGFSRWFFQAVCQLGENGFAQWSTLPAPAVGELEERVAAAPPMRGLEYLDVRLLTELWGALRDQVVTRAQAHRQGPASYLETVNPLWHLLGRVTFHLAENKRDAARPFAFLATYTHKISGQAKLQHLPMAEALKMYAGTKDLAKLESLLEPVKRAADRSPLVRGLLSSKALFAPQAWTIPEAYRFLKEVPLMEEAGLVVRVPDWWRSRRAARPQVQVRLGSRPAATIGQEGLLDFDVQLALDDETLDPSEMQELLAASDGLALLRGRWIEVDRAQLKQALTHWKKLEQEHTGGIDFITGMRLLAGAPIGGDDAVSSSLSDWSRITAGDWLTRTLEQLRRPETIESFQPGRDLQATLRHYQVDGVRWLWFMTRLGLGACLADDMGLGKTIQIIDLLLQRQRDRSADAKTTGQNAINLLIVPASLLGNWKQELARFGPSLKVRYAHRSETDDDSLRRLAADPVRELQGVDLVVSSYSLVRRQEWLTKVAWGLVILDEAQAIKNSGSAQTKAVKKLPAQGRIVLTGTPVENHLGDLWSLFDFCNPGLLGTAAQFKGFVKELNRRQDADAYGGLRRLVRPYILRRMKTDPTIVPDLPEKTEMRAECGLSKKQAVLYGKAVAELEQRLQQADGMARRGLVLSTLMQLKQICNHPAQYLQADAFPPAESSKFARLELLCEPIAQRQEKVLVFTQFQSITEPLAEFLATVFRRPGLVLHGGTAVKKRQELVREFQADGGPPFFVISLKAGGSGLNLTAASHVVHFDRWWNPAVENQATDRAFRIGQKRNVMVHKFVCRGTVEERIDEMIRDKQATADKILNQDNETLLTEMSDKELLKFVALDISRATADD
ncbi:MAG: DEAD/DEAH box helicase [Planctomycetes bacterium]|nr:DEAD/DEAH box helicase [Planctomycetota bacterium]